MAAKVNLWDSQEVIYFLGKQTTKPTPVCQLNRRRSLRKMDRPILVSISQFPTILVTLAPNGGFGPPEARAGGTVCVESCLGLLRADPLIFWVPLWGNAYLSIAFSRVFSPLLRLTHHV